MRIKKDPRTRTTEGLLKSKVSKSYCWVQCCGSGMFIPDPGHVFFHPGSRIRSVSIPDPGSRIRIEEFKYFNQKKRFLSSRKYDPGCSSRIADPDAYFLPIPDHGSRCQKGTRSRIRIRNTGWVSSSQRNNTVYSLLFLKFSSFWYSFRLYWT